MICNSPSKVIEPIRSRCLAVRIPAPSNEELVTLLSTIAKKEGCTLDQETAAKITVQSNRNIRRAILMLEAMKVQAGTNVLTAAMPITLPDWELYINKLARDILGEQSPAKLQHARDMLYELLTNCIPPDVIMSALVNEIMKSLDDSLKHEVVYWAAYYEHRLRQGSKEIFHLEAFIAKFMAIYKKWLATFFD